MEADRGISTSHTRLIMLRGASAFARWYRRAANCRDGKNWRTPEAQTDYTLPRIGTRMHRAHDMRFHSDIRMYLRATPRRFSIVFTTVSHSYPPIALDATLSPLWSFAQVKSARGFIDCAVRLQLRCARCPTLIPRTHNDNRIGSISRGGTPSTLVPLAYHCHPAARSTNGRSQARTQTRRAFCCATAPLVSNRTSTGNTPSNSSIRCSAWFLRMTRRLPATLDIRRAYVTSHAQRYYGECLLGRLRRTMESQSLDCSLQRAKSLGVRHIYLKWTAFSHVSELRSHGEIVVQ